MASRTIKVGRLARVEGEGALRVRLRDGRVEEVELRILEPPRLFEGFLRGRSHMEAPDVTSRICGICPVAYQMSSCHAIEDALGLEVDAPLRALRRLFYCGEWIESHALSVFMLNSPDFLGFDDAIAMAKVDPEPVRRGLRVKKAGNAIVATLGGREIHPVNARVGGFYRAPTRAELDALLPVLHAARDDMRAAVPWLAALPIPDLERDVELVALRHPDAYPFCEGRVASTKGLDVAVRDFEDHIEEEQVRRSTALHARMRGRGTYACGPLARVNLNFDRLTDEAKDAARAMGLSVPCQNPFKGIVARAVEIVYALEEAERLIAAYAPPPRAFVEAAPRAGTGHGATEAPRGLLYHRYRLDADGTILDARIVPPTSQNQRAIEEDLAAMASVLASLPLREATLRAEHAVRNYDPCISCSTHFLELTIEDA